MNKISKKIVALATMAAFVLTLVPAAAFATPQVAEDSSIAVNETAYNTATATITVGDKDQIANVVVWVTDKNNKVLVPGTDYQYAGAAGTVWNDPNNGPQNAVYYTTASSIEINYTFDKSGDYTIHAALNDVNASKLSDLAGTKMELTPVTVHADGMAMANASNFAAVVNDELTNTVEELPVDTDLTAKFNILDNDEDATKDTLKNVWVWVYDNETKALTKVAKITDEYGNPINNNGNGYKVGEVGNGRELNIQFGVTGNYTIYAGNGNSLEDAQKNPIKGSITVNVVDDTVVDSMTLTAAWIDDSKSDPQQKEKPLNAPIFRFDKEAQTYVLDLTQVNGFNFNSIDKVVLHGTAFDKDGEKAKHQTINFSASEPNTVVRLTDSTDNTEYTGNFETAFTMESQKNTVITITEPNSGVSYDVLVIAQKTSATDIDATKNGGYVLATTDDQWTADVNANFGSAVQFMVTDEKGDAVEGLTDAAFKLNVESKPEKTSTLTNSDLKVVPVGDGLYTLEVVNAKAGDKILTEGQYEVRVALNGVDSENDNIGLTFTAAEFDKIEDVELNIVDVDTDVALDDQITLGTTADVSLVYVDGNGVKVAGPTDFSWNATNSALAVQSTDNHKLVMKPNTIEHQGVIGSTVLVQAAVPSFGFVDKELTIVSTYNTYSLELDPAEGPVNEYNKVDLNVLNSDGDVAKNINGDINVVVADSSNEDAKVSVKAAKDVKNGEGALTIYASQETELELVVTVEEAGKILAADTLTYTVGTADPLAGRTVVMTIDSTEYVVNNNIITGDAAPYVDSNWRTMVPIRALAESFDAEVYWNQDDETVTIKFDAGTEIVMTVGEETYTVNGAEATMDTEPVNAGDRVYVPIRFAAEGLGFSVTPLYNDAGLTASVVFQR